MSALIETDISGGLTDGRYVLSMTISTAAELKPIRSLERTRGEAGIGTHRRSKGRDMRTRPDTAPWINTAILVPSTEKLLKPKRPSEIAKPTVELGGRYSPEGCALGS